MLSTVIAGWLALSEQSKIIRDFSLWLIEITGVIMVIFFAAHMIQQEIGQNTIFLLLSKNIKRSNIILWKFLWFSCVILFFLVVMGILYIGIGKLYHIPQDYLHAISIIGIFIKLEILLALSMFFSTFVSPFVALFSSIVIYMLSHTMWFVVYYLSVLKKELFSPLFVEIAKIIYYILPNFTSLSVSNFLDTPFLIENIGRSFWFALLFHWFYIAIILFFSIRLFNKKQF